MLVRLLAVTNIVNTPHIYNIDRYMTYIIQFYHILFDMVKIEIHQGNCTVNTVTIIDTWIKVKNMLLVFT